MPIGTPVLPLPSRSCLATNQPASVPETICDIFGFEVFRSIASCLTIVRIYGCSDVPPPTSESADLGRSVADALRLVDQFQRALRRRDRAEIVDRLRQLIAVRAPMAGQWLQLSLMALDLGEVRLGLEAIDLYVESAGEDPPALIKKFSVLARIGRFDEALALIRTIPQTQPDPFTYALSRGAAALNAGETAEARKAAFGLGLAFARPAGGFRERAPARRPFARSGIDRAGRARGRARAFPLCAQQDACRSRRSPQCLCCGRSGSERDKIAFPL